MLIPLLFLAQALPTTVETARVQRETLPGVSIAFAVDAEPDEVITALWAEDNFRAVFPTVTASSTLEETGNTKTVQMTERFLAFESTYVLLLTLEEGRISYVEGPDERMTMRGEFAVEPLGADASKVTYVGCADAGWMIPQETLMKAMEDMAPEIAQNTRALVD